MREKRETLHFAYAGFRDQEKRTIRAEQSQPQYTTPPENYKPFDVDAHLRAARRAMVDAYCLFKDWPSQIRYSYFVGSNGRLMTRAERRGAK